MTKESYTITPEWLAHPDLHLLFNALSKEGATIRLVGGAVRDAFLKLQVEDFDLAINVPPEESMRLLEATGITVKPTGIEYGTVTAIVHKKPYQITTLRTDVETYGRKAEVEFTDDWVADAQRRDFTINALYADLDGKIFDPCGGIKDLKKQKVRFIGDPAKRIQEDYLRILRFFRFSGRFSEGRLNRDGSKACHTFAPQLKTLSKERVTEEFMKILSLPHPSQLLEKMGPELDEIFTNRSKDYGTLSSLEDFQSSYDLPKDPLWRLALMIDSMDEIRLLQFSNADQRRLQKIVELKDTRIDHLKTYLYYYGPEVTEGLTMIQAACNPRLNVGNFSVSMLEIDDWKKPKFPLRGEDVQALGVPAGKELGNILKEVERWWVKREFKPTRQACIERAKSVLEESTLS